MNRKLSFGASVALSALVLTILSCGGGGGGSDTGGDPYAGLNQLKVDVANPTTGFSLDPMNIFPGETVRFRIVGRDSTGGLVYVNGNGWTSNAPGSAGTVQDSGTFNALATSTPFTVSIVVNGSTISTAAQTVPIQAIVAGRIRTTAGAGVSGVTVIYYNAAGTEIGRAKSATDGRLRFSIPTTATRFKLDFSAVDPGATKYVRQFAYNGIDYSTVISGCYATLPTLATGVTANLATEIVVYQVIAGSPPPPPDGCTP